MTRIIKSHNSNAIETKDHYHSDCNCRNNDNFPMEGKCRANNVVYKCTVSTKSETDKVYIGVCEGEWKTSF